MFKFFQNLFEFWSKSVKFWKRYWYCHLLIKFERKNIFWFKVRAQCNRLWHTLTQPSIWSKPFLFSDMFWHWWRQPRGLHIGVSTGCRILVFWGFFKKVPAAMIFGKVYVFQKHFVVLLFTPLHFTYPLPTTHSTATNPFGNNKKNIFWIT